MLLREFWHAADHHLTRLDRGLEIAVEKFKLHPGDTLTTAETGIIVDLSVSNHACSLKLRDLAVTASNAGDYRQARNAVKDIQTPKAQDFADQMKMVIKRRSQLRRARFKRSFAILGAKLGRVRHSFQPTSKAYKTAGEKLEVLSMQAERAGDLIQAHGAVVGLPGGYAARARERIEEKLAERYKPAPRGIAPI